MNICLKPIGEDNFLDAFNLKLGEGQDIYVSHPLAYRVKDGKVSLVKKRTLNWAIDDYNISLFRLCTTLSRDMLIEDVKLYGHPRRRLEEFPRPTILARCMAARNNPPEETTSVTEATAALHRRLRVRIPQPIFLSGTNPPRCAPMGYPLCCQ